LCGYDLLQLPITTVWISSPTDTTSLSKCIVSGYCTLYFSFNFVQFHISNEAKNILGDQCLLVASNEIVPHYFTHWFQFDVQCHSLHNIITSKMLKTINKIFISLYVYNYNHLCKKYQYIFLDTYLFLTTIAVSEWGLWVQYITKFHCAQLFIVILFIRHICKFVSSAHIILYNDKTHVLLHYGRTHFSSVIFEQTIEKEFWKR